MTDTQIENCQTADDVRRVALKVREIRGRSWPGNINDTVKRACDDLQREYLADPPVPATVTPPSVIFHAMPTLKEILETVAQFYEVSINDIRSPRRNQQYARPRQMVFYLGKELTLLSFPMMGKVIGGRDHSTICKSIKKIEAILANNERVRDELALIRLKLGERMNARRK